MNTALTGAAAKDLGKSLRFIRHARDLTLRDVAKSAGLSMQYVQNIERGERANASEEALLKLAVGYGIPPLIVSNLLLRARVLSAFERRGLSEDHQAFLWRGVEQRLGEVAPEAVTDLGKFVTSLLAPA